MSSEYKKSMYEFYTKPENFETMLQVAKQAKWVTQRLIIDFWSKVKDAIEEHLSKEPGNWCVEINGDWNWRWVKIWAFKKPEWNRDEAFPLVSIAIQNLQPDKHAFIGVHIGAESNLIDSKDLKKRLLAIEKLKENYKPDTGEHWAQYKYLEINQSKPEILSKMLTENRKNTIEDVKTEFVELIKLAEEDISKILSDQSLYK